jgi:hypothetical protein
LIGQIACLLAGPEGNAHRQSLRIRAFLFWNSNAGEHVKLFDMNFIGYKLGLIRHARI